ncbi:MAG: peptidase M11 [Desulfuromonas sp.]|nr:MAG: peptidase M11 [Desulfuromonas sp.]
MKKIVGILLSLFAFSLLICIASAGAAPSADNRGLVQAAASQTRSLVTLAAAFEQNGRQDQLDTLLQLAEQRQAVLRQLVEVDTPATLRFALANAPSLSLPEQLTPYLEQAAEFEGILQVVYEDYPDGHILKHYLQTRDRMLALHFGGQAPGLKSGLKVSVNGVVFDGAGEDDSTDGALAVETEQQVLILGLDGGGSAGQASLELNDTFGEQRTLTLLVNFLDQTDQPISVAAADSMVQNDTSDFMLENSYGQTWLSGATYGWFTLPVNATCNSTTISNEANAAAASAGVDVSVYDRVIYLFPRNSSCGWSGQGTVGNKPSKVWLNGQFDVQVVAHEMGHNFGLYHSHSLECGNEVLTGDCTVGEYGDNLDSMGNRNSAHYNVFQKRRLGWLDYGSSPALTTVTGSGTYTIEAQEPQGAASKGLLVQRFEDAATGADNWFTVEYRQAIGFDAFLSGNSNVLGGVVIHAAVEGDVNSSRLLDLTPASSLFADWEDPALAIGQSFTDPVSGLTITPTWGDSASVTVDISYGGTASCVPAVPSVVITPGQSDWVAPGSEVNYSVNITSNDSSACSAATFDLGAAVPAGWGVLLDSSSLSLAPGASGSTTLRVTSSASATDGYYNVAVNASHSANATLAGSAGATYIVSAPATNSAPVAINDQATTPERSAVTIPVLANDSDPDGDSLALTTVGKPASGSVSINADGSVTYSPKGRFTGTDSFSYIVSDGASTSSAIVTVTVGGSSGGGDTGGDTTAGGGKGGGTKGGGGGKGKK